MLFACGQKGYTIKGTITGDSVAIKDGTAYLCNPIGNIMIDSTKITDGRFEFKSDDVKPGSYVIYVHGVKGFIPIFLEDSKFTIEADVEKLVSATVKGGETQNLNNLLKKKGEEIMPREKYNTLQEELMTDIPEERRTEIENMIQERLKVFEDFKLDLVKKNPDSFFAANYIMYNYTNIPLEEAKPLIENVLNNKKFENYLKIDVLRRYAKHMKNQGKWEVRFPPSLRLITEAMPWRSDFTFPSINSGIL